MTDPSQILLEFLGGNVGGYLLGRGAVKLTKLLLTIVSVADGKRGNRKISRDVAIWSLPAPRNLSGHGDLHVDLLRLQDSERLEWSRPSLSLEQLRSIEAR